MTIRTVYVESMRANNGRVCSIRVHDHGKGGGSISYRAYRLAMRRVGALAGDDTLRIAPVGNPPEQGYEIIVCDGPVGCSGVYAKIL